MSSGSDAIAADHVKWQLAHVQVITDMLLTTNVQPSWSHLGHLMGRGQLLFGDTRGTD